MSKETGLICTGESVRAILDGRKTQTRRIIKPQLYRCKSDCSKDIELKHKLWCWNKRQGGRVTWHIDSGGVPDCLREQCPYGKVGDRLYCKEDYKYLIQDDMVITYYKFSINKDRVEYTLLNYLPKETQKKLVTGRQDVWKSKLLMFKFMARIWLEITGIRVERVQDISEEDAIAEGAQYHKYNAEEAPNPTPETRGYWFFENRRVLHLGFGSAKAAFADLWDSINAKRGYGWDANPWCFVLEFRQEQK